jgi:transcriptional regulator with XRE-family HTH domain
MKEMGTIIKEHRIKRGMSQQALATLLFVTKQAVSKWENNKGMPDVTIMKRISECLAISMDVLFGLAEVRKKRFFLIYLLSLMIVLAGLLVYPYVSDYMDTQTLVRTIETQTLIELPRGKYSKNIDFGDWEAYGNSINVSTMSYIIFSDNSKLRKFEAGLCDDLHWMNEISENMISSIPSELLEYFQTSNYCLLFNTDLGLYNGDMDNNEIYHYVFMIYQTDNHRLIFFEYTI